MAHKDVHTVPWNGRWANKRENALAIRRVFVNQRTAILVGREMARKSKSEHFIHRRDGTIRARNSYGHDLDPPKG